MKVSVQAVGFELTDSLLAYSREKARLNLSRFDGLVRKLDVKLVDINGPKGGEAMRCRIVLQQDNSPPIVIQETRDDLYLAISTGFQRAKQAVRRRKEQVLARRKRMPAQEIPFEPASV